MNKAIQFGMRQPLIMQRVPVYLNVMNIYITSRMVSLVVALLSMTLLFTATASAQMFNLRHTFDDPTPTIEDGFGISVALDGGRVLIGALQDDTYGTDVGQAYLFDATSGTLLRTFDDPTVTGRDHFGVSVALDGNRALIGAFTDDTHGTDVGQAHLFDATSGALLQTFDDPSVTTSDWFGRSAALNGDQVLIGAPHDDTRGYDVGQAHLFDATSGTVLQTFNDPTVTTEDWFGSRWVALDGNRALIGAPRDDTQGTNVGQAHLFDATSGALLRTFDDPSVTVEDGFGSALALDGNRVLIGERYDDTHGTDVGRAHLFDASSGALLRTFEDPTPNVAGRDNFGGYVAVDGNLILIGDPGGDVFDRHHVGQAHLFDATSGALLQTFDDPAADVAGMFGWFVDLDGRHVLISAVGTGGNQGRVYLFTLAGDFNSDGACDIDDLNEMLAEGPIAPGVTVILGVNDQFDLTGDGVIDNADADQWLEVAGLVNGFGSSYKRGDANLDGVVDVSDFNDWNANKFTSTLLWDSGNFNGDGMTDVSDFNAWNANKFTASDGLSAIPEPGTTLLSIIALILVGAAGRRN